MGASLCAVLAVRGTIAAQGAAAPLVVSVFDALPDAIGVVWPAVDATGTLLDFEVGYTNPSSERMMGVRLGDEAGGRPGRQHPRVRDRDR